MSPQRALVLCSSGQFVGLDGLQRWGHPSLLLPWQKREHRRRLWREVGVRGRGGDLLREQDRPEADRTRAWLWSDRPSPFSPSPEDVLGDADIPVWTLAQSSVAMATQWALWWVEEGSRCVVISTGDSSSVLSLRQSRRFWAMGSRSLCPLRKPLEAPESSGLSLLAPIYTCLTWRNWAPVGDRAP